MKVKKNLFFFVVQRMVMVICSGNVLFSLSTMFENFLICKFYVPLSQRLATLFTLAWLVAWPQWFWSKGVLGLPLLDSAFDAAWTPPDCWDAADIVLGCLVTFMCRLILMKRTSF